MRQRHAFLVILIYDEAEPAVLRGRARHVASETEAAFSGAEQLIAFLQAWGAPAEAARALDPAGVGTHPSHTTG